MLTEHRNENLAEMLEKVKADANPAALLRTVMIAIIELCEVTHHIITVSLTDYSDEGDSEAEKEKQEKEEKIKRDKKKKTAVKERVKAAAEREKTAIKKKR